MKIAVIGTRGFPNIPGGVEKHCEKLYQRIAASGNAVIIYRRSPYVDKTGSFKIDDHIQFVDYWVPRSKYIETIFHSFLAAFSCIQKRPDLVHIHNIGPALILSVLKIFNIKSIVTYHSANYEHQKWGALSRAILRFAEKMAVSLADHMIFVSEAQTRKIHSNRKTYIPNGVELPKILNKNDYIKELGLKPKGYVLAVSRIVPEKGVLDLVRAFMELKLDTRLLICGDADHVSEYSRLVKKTASQDERIVLAGYVTGNELEQVYANALLFVLPSHQEGHPIALLEALSFRLPVLVSNIPQNIEIKLPKTCYFEISNQIDLRKKLESFFGDATLYTLDEADRIELLRKYDWDKITLKTLDVYKKVLSSKQPHLLSWCWK